MCTPSRLVKAIPCLVSLMLSAFHQSAAQNVKFDRIGTDKGLSQANVTAIEQDDLGYVWLGTEDGLNRYNGYEIEVFLHNSSDSLSLPDNRISNLAAGMDGNLYIGTTTGLILFNYSLGSFKLINAPDSSSTKIPSGAVTALHRDQAKNVWFATYSTLSKIDPGDSIFNFYTNSNNINTGLLTNIRTITEDKEGNIWVANLNSIARLNPEDGNIESYKPNPSFIKDLERIGDISSILVDSQNQLWIGGRFGLISSSIYSGKHTLFTNNPTNENSLPNNLITDITLDKQNYVWVGTDDGIAKYIGNDRFEIHQHNPNVKSSISSSISLALDVDNHNRLWLGTRNGGASYFDPSKFSFDTYEAQGNNSDGLNSNQITGFDEDSDGNIYVSTDGGGLNYMNLMDGTFKHFIHNPQNRNSLGGNKVLSVLVDKNQQVWTGMWNGGVTRYNPKTGTFKRYRHSASNPNSLIGDNIFTIYEDKLGRIFIGNWNNGFGVYQPSTDNFRNILHDPENPKSIPNGTMGLFAEDRNGNIWVGSDRDGLAVLNQNFESIKTYRVGDGSGLTSNGILELFIDSKDNVWIGTNGMGICVLDKKTDQFKTYTSNDGLVNNTVLNILEDNQGYYWITTNRGMSRFDPESDTFTNFFRQDGLQDNQFMTRSAMKTSEGKLLFGGVHGFNLFDPSKMKTNAIAPKVFLTSMSLYNEKLLPGNGSPLSESISFTKEITLNYDQNVFTFEYIGLSFQNANKNQYKYKLEGLHDAWMNNGTERKVSFMNLEPGQYTLKINASNNDGIWSEEPATLKITINPPFWATWWFRALIAILISFFSYWIYKNRSEKIKEQKRILQEKVKEATERVKAQNDILQGQSVKLGEAIAETNYIVKEAVNSGNYQARIETLNKEGEWKNLGESVNQLFDSILEPFQEINKIVDHLSIGDLTERYNAEAKGDVERLARNLNHAIDNLSTLLKEVTNQVLVIKSSSTDMLMTSEEMNVSTSEIATSISEMNRGSQDQLVKVDQASALIEAVMKFAAAMRDQAVSIHDAAKAGVDESNQGMDSISRLDNSMQEILNFSEQTNRSIESLGKSSKDITSVLRIIKEIAAQTNLLALNAAIEAAQAGDAGRGFSVVAEEIRKLAESSKKSVGDIEELISTVQKETSETANLVVSMGHRIKEGGEATKISLNSFQSISSKYEKTLNQSDQILQATNQQSEDMRNIVDLMNSIVVIAEETAAGTEQVASSSAELAAGMENYIQKNRDVTAITDKLTEKVNQFKL